MLTAVLFDLMLPTASGRLIDTLTATTRDTHAAWRAWAFFLAVYVGFVVTRNIGFRFWNPLAARNMQEMSDEGFRRVQSFSADWHADNFAGATVRKLSRAMWGYDAVSDAVVLWLGPALIVLFGLAVQMPSEVRILDGYQGVGRAEVKKEELDLLLRLARLEGILLDPVYTAKAFGGLLDVINRHPGWLGRRVCFIHTGGVFSVFPFRDSLGPLVDA